MTMGAKTGLAFVVLTLSLFAVAVAPAAAIQTNDLFFQSTLLGTGGGGNLSDAQIAQIATDNEKLLLAMGLIADIQLIGKVEVSGGASGGSFTDLNPTVDFSNTFQSVVCNSGPITDCKTGYTVTFNFGALANDWQIVKIVNKGGGPTDPTGDFLTDSLFSPPLDDVQKGSISTTEWSDYCQAAVGAATCPSNFPGVSNFLVFGTTGVPVPVSGPTTVLLIGTGLLGLALARKIGH